MMPKIIRMIWGALLFAGAITMVSAQPRSEPFPTDASFLYEAYPKHKISPVNPAALKHVELMEMLEELQAAHPDMIAIEKLGESVEGRSINLVTMGRGPRKVLLWSQMHGDEPTATAALLDIMEYLTENPSTEFARDILSRTTLLMILMLNPDGAEQYNRRNAMDIDINRDARYLATPEGRILKQAQERFRPDFGFNLHDHSPRYMVGRTKKFVAISLLVPPVDYDDTQNETTLKARKVAAAFYQSIAPWCYGHLSRYNADYMPRAFGDSMQEWGVSTILVESGGWEGRDRSELTRLNFVGLLSAFHAIATESYQARNPTLYDQLQRSSDISLFDLMIERATIVNGLGHAPFVGDIGINFTLDNRSSDWRIRRASIADLGDLRVTSGKTVIGASGMVCVPGFIAVDPGVKPGASLGDAARKALADKGVMVLIGQADLRDEAHVKALGGDDDNATDTPPRIEFAGYAGNFPGDVTQADRDLFLRGISRGLLGVYPAPANPALADYLQWFRVHKIPIASMAASEIPDRLPVASIPALTHEAARQYGLGNRGVIQRGAAADLLLFEKDEDFEKNGILKLENLKIVIHGGVAEERARSANDQ